jgi:hypothetical protein
MKLPLLLIEWQPMQWPPAVPLSNAWGAPSYFGLLDGPPSSVQTWVGVGWPALFGSKA